MDCQQTRGSNGSKVGENARLSCAAKKCFEKKKKRISSVAGLHDWQMEESKITSYRARRRCDFVSGVPFPSPILPGRVCGCGATPESGASASASVGLDLATSFADEVAVAVIVVMTAAAGASSFPADLSPALAAGIGAMDGRAACSVPKRPPTSSSRSLRFSLRACDFEYGARDASKPVGPPTCVHTIPRFRHFSVLMDWGHAWANITVVADRGARVGPYAIREAPNLKKKKE